MFYGACLGLSGRLCTVIGGGRVASRKVRTLLQAGARVRVISPALVPELAERAAQGQIVHVQRPYTPGDLCDAVLVVAATDERSVNAAVAAEAQTLGRWVNVVDHPEEGNFIVPAVLSADAWQVIISTHGRAPALAKRLREALAADLEDGGSRFVDLLREHRRPSTEGAFNQFE